MRRVLEARWLPFAVFGVAFCVRALYLAQIRTHPLHDSTTAIIDSLYYHRHAVEVAGGDFLHGTPFFLGPLYPYTMGLLYALFGSSIEVVRWVQAVLGAASCSLLFGIGERLFDRRVALGAGLLLAVYPLHLFYTSLILPTTLVLFVQLLLLWLVARQVDAPSLPGAAGAGLVLGLAVLAKSNALLLLPTLLVVWLWLARERALRLRVLWCGVFATLALATLLPATFHNWKASGHLVLLTTSTGRNLWKGNGPIANGTHPLGNQDRGKAGLGKQMAGVADPVEVVEDSADYIRSTFEYVVANPGATALLWGKKLVLFANAVELGVRDQFYFAQDYAPLLRLPVSYAWVAPLGLAGAVAAWSLRRKVLLLHALLAVQVASFVVVFVLARYRIVAVACLLLFACSLVVTWVDHARAGRWRAVVPTALLALLAAVLTNWPLPEFPPHRGYALLYERIGDDRHRDRRHAEAVDAYLKALGEDWQGQDPNAKRAETRIKIARDYEAQGDRAAAREQLQIVLDETEVEDLRALRATQKAEEELARLEGRRP